MFAIILVLIAIGLTILASIVTLSYLLDDGQNAAKAEAAKILNQASQIQGAIVIARTDGVHLNTDSSLDELHPRYLADIPEGAENWGFGENNVFKTDVKDNVCLAANLSLGHVFKEGDPDVRKADSLDAYIPYCDNPNLSPNVPCCDNSRTATPDETPQV